MLSETEAEALRQTLRTAYKACGKRHPMLGVITVLARVVVELKEKPKPSRKPANKPAAVAKPEVMPF